MAWSLNASDILILWKDQDTKPSIEDEAYLKTVNYARIILNQELDDIEERLLKEEDLLEILNYIASSAIQRAWEGDFSGRTSQSYTQGPFGTSWSKPTAVNNGIYFTTAELSQAAPKAKKGRVKVISMAMRPDFGPDDYLLTDYFPATTGPLL